MQSTSCAGLTASRSTASRLSRGSASGALSDSPRSDTTAIHKPAFMILNRVSAETSPRPAPAATQTTLAGRALADREELTQPLRLIEAQCRDGVLQRHDRRVSRNRIESARRRARAAPADHPRGHARAPGTARRPARRRRRGAGSRARVRHRRLDRPPAAASVPARSDGTDRSRRDGRDNWGNGPYDSPRRTQDSR
ncbi:hypothetical protein SAMN05421783_11080 [Thiocapsa roseopersicina]|uniref:Uncharacterized protein n=1 Tax=Thiocapsa roseopersicina TaxID=1058 RepID=A0A1H2X8H9_THIRO|nr:hypothetical protein SAMN05421783_11080 [Thiocapsa roseopersicina]